MNYTNKYAVQQFIYIAQPGKRLLGVVGGVDYSTSRINKKGNNTVSLSFVAYESFNGEKSAWYDYLDELMEIFVDGIWFIIKNPPEVNHDGKIESKTIEAESYEIGLQNYDIQRFKVGQGTESSYEMMFQKKYPKEKYPDKYKNSIPTVKFYNPDEPELSLLHILLHHAGLIPSKKVIDSDGNEIDNWIDNIADSPWQIGEVDTMPRHIDSSGQELENPTYLPEDSYAFDIDNSDLYSVLTQDVSNAFSCIFTFDTVNCKINATYVDHIGKDTNAYIGWRNIQNSLKATRKDELFTTVTVSGGEGIDNIVSVNFGDTDIEDYSYLLEDERYIPTSLKEKYKAWVKYRESKRLDYINLQKKYVDVQEKATEVKSRVPIDGSTEDWSSKSIKDLMQAYDDYTALIRAYESEYIKEDGSFDLDALKKSADWDRYEQIVNYILPTIINKLVSTTDSEANDIKESLKDYGSGNILKNATFITSSNWYGIGSSLSECNVLDASPVYGATRCMTIHSNSDSCGIKQKEISTTKGSTYTLSAFIRSANANKIKLGYCSSNDNNDYSKVTYIERDITSTWTRVQITFTAPSDISEIYFLCEGTNIAFDITAPMLELGENASTFQYFQMDEEYQKSYLTDWKLYGVDELTSCQKKYSDQMEVLEKYSQEYDSSITDNTEEVYNSYHQLYLDYKKLYDDCTSALAKRQKEYDNLISERNNYKSEYDTIATNVKRENFGNVQTEYPAFTKYEEFLLKKLYKHTDYQNENIISTSITSSVEKIEKEYKLYLDAVERLYAASHPQYTWEDTLDNIYGLEEFQCLIEPLDIYNFIHAEINNNGTFEKLRVTGITYNPCIYQGDFSLTFSSITRYKTKKNDFNDLLSSALSAQKNALTLSAGNSKDVTSYTITPEFIKSLLGSSSFNAYMSKNNAGTVSGITGNFTNLYSKYIDAEQITAQLVKADSAEFKKLVSESIQTDILTTKILNADKGFFNSLTTELLTGATGNTFIDFVHNEMKTGTITADQIRSEDGKTFVDLVNGQIQAAKITTDQISGGDGITFVDFLKNQIATSNISADKITGLSDSKTFIDFVNNQINTSELNAEVGNITNLLSGSAGIGDLQAIHLTTANAVIDEAVVKNLIAAKISVADLMTHSASAELITLISQDRKPSIAFKGSTQQFYDSNGNVRVQIGQDATGAFTFSLFDEAGTGILIDSKTGVHAGAIADGLIVNDMIQSGTVSKDKLSFPIVETDENGKISITNILDGKGNEFGVSYTEYQESVATELSTINNNLSGVSSTVSKIDKSIADKIWESDITTKINDYDQTTVKDIRDRTTSVEKNITGITSTVKDMQTTLESKADGTTVQSLTTRVSKAEQDMSGFKQTVESTYSTKSETESVNSYAKTSFEQLSDKFSWLVDGKSSSTSLTLTDSLVSAITNQFVIKSPDGTSTIIEGGKIKTGAITTDMLSSSAIKSKNYKEGTYVDGAGYSVLGTFLDLDNGMIHTPGFYTDVIGNAFLAGTVHASAGWFGTEEHNWFLGTTTITNIMNDSGALIDSDYSYLKATDNAAIVAGDWYLMAQNSDIGLRSGLSTLNGGNFVKNPVDGKYYDFGIVEPDMTSDAKDYNKSFLYIRRAQTKQTHPQDWEYLFRVDYEGKIWYGNTLIAGKGGAFLSTTGGTITGDLVVEGKLTANATSADKLTKALSINGKAFDGSIALDVGAIGIAYGGTGATSASGARTNLGAMGAVFSNEYYGLTPPDGNDISWIRTTKSGIIPYQSGNAGDGHSNLGTSTWYFSEAYIDTIYGNLNGTATKASQDGSGNVIADTYLRKDFDTVGQNVTFNSSVGIDDLTAGSLLVSGNARFVNGLKGELTGNVNGTASYAEKLKTARKIGNASFDGSKDISLNDIGASASGHTHNYVSKIQFAGTDYNSVSNVVTITKENLQSALGTTGLGLITEKERSKLDSIKVSSGGTIDFSGVTASGALTSKTNDDKTVLITHNKSGVSSGTYKSVTVDDYGHVISGSNPTTLSGYGITDALNSGTKYALSDSVRGNALKANLLANLFPTSRPTSANIDITGSGGLSTFKATSSMTTEKPMTDGHILHFYWDNTGGWDAQLFVSIYSNTHAQIRSQSNGKWGNWRTLLDDNNFSDYAALKSHNHDGSYLKLSGGTMTGTISHTENTLIQNYRPNNRDYRCGLMYQTAGNEALVYVAKNKVTSFMFLNGVEPTTMASNTWQSANPALQIKQNSVYVNELIPNDVTPSYTFSVKGNSNLNGEVVIGNGCMLKYDQDADCLDFIFN